MTNVRVLFLMVLLAVAPVAVGQQAKDADLEKVLADVNLQWLCAGQYYKAKAQDCVDFRAQFWADQFFEMNQNGLQNKAEMVAGQTARAKVNPDVFPGEGPNPTEFKLMAVYGNIAMAVDHTLFKIRLNVQGQPDFDHAPAYLRSDHWYPDGSGKLAVVREVRFVRIFVNESGKWRPAAGVSVPLPLSK